MPPRFKMAQMTRIILNPVRTLAFELAFGRISFFIIPVAMEKPAPLSRYRAASILPNRSRKKKLFKDWAMPEINVSVNVSTKGIPVRKMTTHAAAKAAR